MKMRFLNTAYFSPRYLGLAIRQELKFAGVRGLVNLAHNFISMNMRPEEIASRFTVLQIEPTINCNLSCDICDHEKNIPGAALDFSGFKLIVDQFPSLRQVNLTGRGESFLNGDIYRMIRYAKGKNIYTRITTNAVLLDEEKCREIIASGLDELRISVDSADPEKYRKIKGNADIGIVEKNISCLNALRNGRHPVLEFNTVVFRQNIHDLRQIIFMAHRLNVGAVFASGLVLKNASLAVKDNLLTAMETGEIERVYSEAMSLAKKLGIYLRLPNFIETRTKCSMPWLYCYITYDGYVFPCCMAACMPQRLDETEKYSMGNILKDPWSKIKNSPKFRGFRKTIKEGKPHPLCAGCSILNGTF